jgi:hypothetical protein
VKVGDLIQDHNDGEIGLVVAIGPGYNNSDCQEYPNGVMPSWKIDWPSVPGFCDIGDDALKVGLVIIISKA